MGFYSRSEGATSRLRRALEDVRPHERPRQRQPHLAVGPATDEHARRGHVDRAGAERLKEHIDSMLELNNQFYPGQPLSLAVGIATCLHAHELELACQEADRAMYAAKAHYYATHHIERRRPGSVA